MKSKIIVVEFWDNQCAQFAFALETTDIKRARKAGRALKKKFGYPRSFKTRFYRAASITHHLLKHHRTPGF